MKDENLRFCWEQYIKLIDILITISTGSIIVITSIFISNDIIINESFSTLLICGFFALLTGIILLIFWRITSQTLMEYELLNDEKSNLTVTILIKKIKNYKSWKRLVMWSSGILIFLSWILLGIYLINARTSTNKLESIKGKKVTNLQCELKEDTKSKSSRFIMENQARKNIS